MADLDLHLPPEDFTLESATQLARRVMTPGRFAVWTDMHADKPYDYYIMTADHAPIQAYVEAVVVVTDQVMTPENDGLFQIVGRPADLLLFITGLIQELDDSDDLGVKILHAALPLVSELVFKPGIQAMLSITRLRNGHTHIERIVL